MTKMNSLTFFLYVDINDCALNPCQNGGTCVDKVNNYTCSCVPGYTGRNCSTGKSMLIKIFMTKMNSLTFFLYVDINDCAVNPCENGGTCTDKVNNYICSCVPGYTGRNCSTGKSMTIKIFKTKMNSLTLFLYVDINDCALNPCQNGGTCVDKVNNYTCSCVPGYTGRNCSTGKSMTIKDIHDKNEFPNFLSLCRYQRLRSESLSKWRNMYG